MERKKIRKKKNMKGNLSMREMIWGKSSVFCPCKYWEWVSGNILGWLYEL